MGAGSNGIVGGYLIGSTSTTGRQSKPRTDQEFMIKDDYPGLDFLGLQDVLSSKTRWYKAAWLAILAVNCTLGIICTISVIDEYNLHPTATLISFKSSDKLLLPQVTVCGTVADHANFDDFYIHAIPTLPGATNTTLLDLMVYVFAGSGYQKFDDSVLKWNTSYVESLKPMYEKLRGNMTVKEYFHYGMDKYGLQCKDLFQQCKLGEDTLDCCEIFKPSYTIRRGRCFRSKYLHQVTYDEAGKLGLRFKEPKKLFPKLSTEQLIIYLNEYKSDIEPFPRNYMYSHDYNKFRVRATEMKLIQRRGICTEETDDIGKSTCYMERWLINNLESKFNCTLAYMDTLRPTNVEPCQPHIILENYPIISQASGYDSHNVVYEGKRDLTMDFECTLACRRTEYDLQIERTASNFTGLPYKYRADINYNDLQYQLIEEVTTISFLGLVSQLGGQIGLFLGSSIIDLIQLALIILILGGRYARSAVYSSPQGNTLQLKSKDQM